MTELIPGKRYRYTYEAEGVARSDKSGIDFDNGGSVEAADFSPLFEQGYLKLLLDPLPTTRGSIVRDTDGTAWQLYAEGWQSTLSGALSRLPNIVTGKKVEPIAPFDVLFDAGA